MAWVDTEPVDFRLSGEPAVDRLIVDSF